MKYQAQIFDGRKAVDIWNGTEGWTILSGGEADIKDKDFYKLIPTLYRAVQLRGNSVSSVPFQLLKNDEVYDESANWQNEIGFMPNPFTLLQLIEAALTLMGKAYIFKIRNRVNVMELRYHLPSSIVPVLDSSQGLTGFTRNIGTSRKDYKVEDYIYFWLPDPYVEIGPPTNFPAKAAAQACGVLANIDEFATNFFERGAIKAMLLTVKGQPIEAERQKLKAWWNNVIGGVKNAFRAEVINAELVSPVIVGEGMKELENVTIERDKREDIAIALGIPMSILFSNAANYATSQEDELHYLNKTVIPECNFIASILNEQLFEPMDMHFEFLPESLSAFQEDETSRAQSLTLLVQAINDPLSKIAMDILGYDLSAETMEELEKLWTEKKERAERLAANMPPPQPQPVQIVQPESEPKEEEPEEIPAKADLDKWKRKAIKGFEKTGSAVVSFESDYLDPEIVENIRAQLAKCQSVEDIKNCFGDFKIPTNGKPTPEQLAELTAALREAALAVRGAE